MYIDHESSIAGHHGWLHWFNYPIPGKQIEPSCLLKIFTKFSFQMEDIQILTSGQMSQNIPRLNYTQRQVLITSLVNKPHCFRPGIRGLCNGMWFLVCSLLYTMIDVAGKAFQLDGTAWCRRSLFATVRRAMRFGRWRRRYSEPKRRGMTWTVYYQTFESYRSLYHTDWRSR